jgi:isochorismate hydrolase
MDGFVYGQRRPLPQGFDEFLAVADPAIVSIVSIKASRRYTKLPESGSKRLVLNGCMTDCCILNSAFDASNLGYRVTVAWDLVRGTNPEMEDAALNMVSLHIGLIAESGDLLAERRRQVAAGNAAVR